MALKKNPTPEEREAYSLKQKEYLREYNRKKKAERESNPDARKEFLAKQLAAQNRYLDKVKADPEQREAHLAAGRRTAKKAKDKRTTVPGEHEKHLQRQRETRAQRMTDPETRAAYLIRQNASNQRRAEVVEDKKAAYAAQSAASRKVRMTDSGYRAARSEYAKQHNQKPEVREAIRVWRREYVNMRLETDPVYSATTSIRKMIHSAIVRGTGTKKTSKTAEYLGCSPKEATEHIAGLFTEGMSWANHGEWHMDHIRPVASFDHSDPNWVFEANHYTNLQPLWAADNLAKKDKWEAPPANVQ